MPNIIASMYRRSSIISALMLHCGRLASVKSARLDNGLILPTCARPHVIAHRGACGYLPEHTLQAYRLAIDLGVEYVEPDLVITRDGYLVCRHDADLSETTDVASRPEFADRIRNITFPSVQQKDEQGRPDLIHMQGFFSFDFTLAEIRTLRARQRITQRPDMYDGLFEIPTFEEVIDMVDRVEASTGRRIGIYTELKEPYFFHTHGLDVEGKLVDILRARGFLNSAKPPAGSSLPAPIIVESFDPQTLQRLHKIIPTVPLVQLIKAPWNKDGSIAYHQGRDCRFGQLSLEEISTYALGIGPQKQIFTTTSADVARNIVQEAHDLGLAVHPYTFRREKNFVDRRFNEDSDAEMRFFFECLNVDGLFVEFPDQASLVIERIMEADYDEDEVLRDWNGKAYNASAARSEASVEDMMAGQGRADAECLALRKSRSCRAHDPARIPYQSSWIRRNGKVVQ